MNVVEIWERISNGEKIFGLRINHATLKDTDSVAECVLNQRMDVLRDLCSVTDLHILYYRLTGKVQDTTQGKSKLAEDVRDASIAYKNRKVS